MNLSPRRTRTGLAAFTCYAGLALAAACSSSGEPSSSPAASKSDAHADGGLTIDGSVVGDAGSALVCGGERCSPPVVTPLATFEPCCSDDDRCGFISPPPTGTGKCVATHNPGAIDPSCPAVARPYSSFSGCCTPNGSCGAWVNSILGYTLDYGCTVTDPAYAIPTPARACTPSTDPKDAVWHPDPVVTGGECRPTAGVCIEECGCKSCTTETTACLNDVDCKAIMECGIAMGCNGIGCLTPCQSVLTAHSAGVKAALDFSTCTQTSCPECTPASKDAGR
jgi:hypothetical protein